MMVIFKYTAFDIYDIMILIWEANFIVTVSQSALWLKTMCTNFLVSKFVFMMFLQQHAQAKKNKNLFSVTSE